MKYPFKWCLSNFTTFFLGLLLLSNILLNENQYTLALSTSSRSYFHNNFQQRNHSWSILVVTIGASQRSQSMQRITQELSLRGHRIRVIFPGTSNSNFRSGWSYNVEWIPVTEQVTSTENNWMTTEKENRVKSLRPTDSKHPRISKVPQFSESPVDHTLRQLWHEKSAWKTLSHLPKYLLFPLRHWLFDAIWKEIQRDKPDMIFADIGAFAAWDIADLFDIPLFLVYCGPLFPISSESGLKEMFLPPPLSGYSRNTTLLQAGLFIFQKWLYEIYTSPALHKLNRLRWYRGLDSYPSVRDLLYRKHIYIFPTTFAFDIYRSISPHYYLLSGPLVPQCTESLPVSAIELAKLYSEQVVLINLEGAYLSKVTTLSIVNELHTLSIGFWWTNGTCVQPDLFPNNFYSLQRQLVSCALSNSMVSIVVVPCLSDVVQEVLYFGKPVLCIATGAVQLDVAARLIETHAGESILSCGDTIWDDLTNKLQDMFNNLELYSAAAIQMSLKIRMETCGLDCICDTMESIFSGSNRQEDNTGADYSLLDHSLFYFAVAYVVGYVLLWFAKRM